jgi:hypothetical protein
MGVPLHYSSNKPLNLAWTTCLSCCSCGLCFGSNYWQVSSCVYGRRGTANHIILTVASLWQQQKQQENTVKILHVLQSWRTFSFFSSPKSATVPRVYIDTFHNHHHHPQNWVGPWTESFGIVEHEKRRLPSPNHRIERPTSTNIIIIIIIIF